MTSLSNLVARDFLTQMRRVQIFIFLKNSQKLTNMLKQWEITLKRNKVILQKNLWFPFYYKFTGNFAYIVRVTRFSNIVNFILQHSKSTIFNIITIKDTYKLDQQIRYLNSQSINRTIFTLFL